MIEYEGLFETDSVIWCDGNEVPWQKATTHLLTYTLHYGVGVYEGIRAYPCDSGIAIFRLQEHIDRLYRSAKILNIAVPYSPEQLVKATVQLVISNQFSTAYIRPMIYLDGNIGLHATDLNTRVIITAFKWNKPRCENGLKLHVSSIRKHSPNSHFNQAKANGNYITVYLAMREAKSLGFDDAILLDSQGYVAEASAANLFLVRGNKLITPFATSALAGITRETVLTIAKDQGLEIEEKNFVREDLYNADEVFITGTAAEIAPVCEIDGRQILTGKPGPVCLNLSKVYRNIVTGKNRHYSEWLTVI